MCRLSRFGVSSSATMPTTKCPAGLSITNSDHGTFGMANQRGLAFLAPIGGAPNRAARHRQRSHGETRGTRSLRGRPGNEQIQSVGVERLAPVPTPLRLSADPCVARTSARSRYMQAPRRDAYHVALF